MNDFLQRHGSSIVGVISGSDRVLCQGDLRSISYVKARERSLWAHQILYKDSAAFVQYCTAALDRHARVIARRAGRPYQYIAKPPLFKEDLARQLARRHGVKKGLVCAIAAVEP